MNIIRQFLNDNIRIWLVILLLSIGGIISFLNISRQEDPLFTIKTAVIMTAYPGASARQIEQQVTRPLEQALQRLPYVEKIRSISGNGLSQITLQVLPEYSSQRLPQIWDEVRNKIEDDARLLPEGVSKPLVMDDFGDVYGYYFSLSGEHYSLKELNDYAEYIRRELMLVPGVSKVIIAGQATEEVHIETTPETLAHHGLTPNQLAAQIADSNGVVDSGKMRVNGKVLPVRPTGQIHSLKDFGDIFISPPGSAQSVQLRDIATISRGVTATPENRFYADGIPAITVGVATKPNVNVIEVGKRVEAVMAGLMAAKPAGMHFSLFYDQSSAVNTAVNGFILNFVMAIVIVLVTLVLIMGLRNGIVIAASLAINVLGSLLIMYVAGIDLQRVSLGAMIIVLSMLTDNAIEMVEGVRVGRSLGKNVVDAILWNIKRTAFPLFGATIIAILAFAPIGLSQNSTGEYCRSLFLVLMIALLLSWATSLTLTPVFIKWAFSKSTPIDASGKVQRGRVIEGYRHILEISLNHKAKTLMGMALLLALSVYGFSHVRQNFFPSTSMPVLFADLWLPQNTDIRQTSAMAKQIESFVRSQAGVDSTLTTIGQGGIRFTLTYSGQRRYDNYAQIMIKTKSLDDTHRLLNSLGVTLQHKFPEVNANIKRIMFGPSNDSSIDIQFSGPDPDVLRKLGNQAQSVLLSTPNVIAVRNDWQERSKVLIPHINNDLALMLGVDKREVDRALKMNFGGSVIGVWNDESHTLPIVLRPPETLSHDASQLQNMMVWSRVQQRYIPLLSVMSEDTIGWEDPVIIRENRIRTLSVLADPDPASGKTPAEIVNIISPAINAIQLPEGYHLKWAGDVDASSSASKQLFRILPLGFLSMFVITVLMFSSVRTAIAIWLTIPLALIGVTAGFLLTGIPFGFMALIGLLSLSGIMIRSGIVLVDEIHRQSDSKALRLAVMDAATARFPIMMTTFISVFGLAPLLRDGFFQSMAVVIMGGLGFAIVLILFVLPVLYEAFHNKNGTKGDQ
ncbi:MAG: efflux RND transporter permease subunit [Pantoea sp.]|uniref:efflux RND transporter permease subunit n=1 Tax=Pantoea sp. TaxID=69393 RepID=UPI002385FB86|nr:efflux RND transporter permease subunit [Pantoea sp.]MDE1185471.1 efflux RND transporter permease subunit [Pantoea sp.]